MTDDAGAESSAGLGHEPIPKVGHLIAYNVGVLIAAWFGTTGAFLSGAFVTIALIIGSFAAARRLNHAE